MSWSVSVPVTPVDEFHAKLDATNPSGDLKQEVAEQVVAAKEALKGILASGALGVPAAVSASLYGHANDGHQATSSVADTIGVSLQVSPAPSAIEEKLAEQQPVDVRQGSPDVSPEDDDEDEEDDEKDDDELWK